MSADGFKPITRDEVSELALLPRRFDQFASEVRQSFELLAEKLIPTLARLEEVIADHGRRLSDLEQHQRRTDDRLAVLEAKLLASGGR